MSIFFKDLKIGEKFHIGKTWLTNRIPIEVKWEEFEKISASKAKVIKQVGYGNTRGEGSIRHFYPNTTVFKLEEEEK